MFFSLGRMGGYSGQFTLNSTRAAILFFKFLFYPIGFLEINFLQPLYNFLVYSLPNLLVLISIASVAIFALWFFSRHKKDKPILFLFFWLFTFLFAFSTFGIMMAWYSYVPLVPVVLLLGIFLKRHCNNFSKSQVSRIVSVLIAALFISFILFSPLFVTYEQPLLAGKITQKVLNQTQYLAKNLPNESEIYLVNYPAIFFVSEKGFDYSFFMVNWASSQAMFDFSFPKKNLDVFSLSSSNLFVPNFNENQFSFTKKDNCVFLVESRKDKYRKVARIFPARRWAKDKNDAKGIVLNTSHTLEVEAIEIILPEQECRNAFFLFFDGKDVKALNASEMD